MVSERAEDVTVGPLAQTILQLYRQLETQSYPPEDVARVRDAYVLAMRLFAGQYRPTGKTFLAHVVGTASALAEARAPVTLIVAGLLHSAYTHGDFGLAWRPFANGKRARVRAAIGTVAETIVAGYGTLPWNANAVRALLASPTEPAANLRDVVIVRLANEADDFADLAGLYRERWEQSVADARSFLPLCAQLAARFGEAGIAARLFETARETVARNEPLIETIASGRSVTIAPASYTRRASARVKDAAGATVALARRVPALRKLRRALRRDPLPH